MELRNETPFPAQLHAADLGGDVRHAVLIWKVTYALLPGGAVGYADDPMPITGDPLPTPYGMFHGDIFFRKVGADLCVLGRLYRSSPVTQAVVRVRCGAFEHAMRVTGDRVWLPRVDGGLTASAPVPFTEMPLSYERAFGGVARSQGVAAAHPDNPDGRGYSIERDDAEGKALPNLEAADGPFVTAWDDAPAPVGWGPYPMSWGLRAREAVRVDPERVGVEGVSPSLFNNAHPALVLPEILPGDPVELTGVYDAPIGFALPRVAAAASVRVGAKVFDAPTRIDAVHVWLDVARLVVTWRANFRYVVREGEVRGATLRAVTV